MIGDNATIKWLKHRAGIRKLNRHPCLYETKGIELNDKGGLFADAYGKKEIRAFVGFIDLVGFSTRVAGLSPSQICDYLRPFLKGVIDETVNNGALVDKTIEDEVMFVLLDMEEDGGVPGVLSMGPILGGLHDLQRKLGADYQYRIGLAYGNQYVDHIEGKSYREWTVIEETVKEDHVQVGSTVTIREGDNSLPGAEPISGFGGAFGALVKEISEETFQAILNIIVGFGSKMAHRVIENDIELKGISSARCAIIFPKESS